MAEQLRTAAISFALTDDKIFDFSGVLPEAEHAAADAFLLNQAAYTRCAGGSVANTVAAYAGYSGNETRLYYTIADDSRGNTFYNETGAQLGMPQIRDDGYTGFCIIGLAESGEIATEITCYGVSRQIEIPKAERTDVRNQLVIANLNSVRDPQVMDQVGGLLQSLDARRGIFAFRLSGAHADFVTREQLLQVINDVPVTPTIVFANEHELENLAGHNNQQQALGEVFPNSRIFVLSRGSGGVIIRYEGELIDLPPHEVGRVIDVTGAGDHLMGATLAELMENRATDWSKAGTSKAVLQGIKAAVTTIRTTRSRLTPEQLQILKKRNRHGNSNI